jgi:hypothetical protein
MPCIFRFRSATPDLAGFFLCFVRLAPMEIRIDKDGNVTDTIISPGIASGLEPVHRPREGGDC